MGRAELERKAREQLDRELGLGQKDPNVEPVSVSVLEACHTAFEAIRRAGPDMDFYLIAFNDGSYKKLRSRKWKHSQWLHFTLADGSVVRVNPANVNYMHQGVSE